VSGSAKPSREAGKNYVRRRQRLLKSSQDGISTLFSYCGAQSFEAVSGLDADYIISTLPGTTSRIGIDLSGIEREECAGLGTLGAPYSGWVRAPAGGEYQLRAQGEVPSV